MIQLLSCANVEHLSSWLPLLGGDLTSSETLPIPESVNALAWDHKHNMLFIGGKFDRLGGRLLQSPSLVTWTLADGVLPFVGGGVEGGYSGSVLSLAFDSDLQACAHAVCDVITVCDHTCAHVHRFSS